MTRITTFSIAVGVLIILLPATALAQGTLFVEGSNVGVNIETPAQEFHLFDGADANSNSAFRISTASHGWDFATIENIGAFRISKLGTGVGEFDLNANGNLRISGELFTSGSCSSGCDLVFSADYELESIEEHAVAMWAEKHLPGVGPTKEEGTFNLSQKTLGMLNELEKAHIYIEQLHTALQEKQARLESLQDDNHQILERLEEIEASLDLDR